MIKNFIRSESSSRGEARGRGDGDDFSKSAFWLLRFRMQPQRRIIRTIMNRMGNMIASANDPIASLFWTSGYALLVRVYVVWGDCSDIVAMTNELGFK